MDAWDVIEKLDGPRLSIPTALVAACGDLRVAAFLQQAAYLSALRRGADGWFFLPQSGGPVGASEESLFQKLGSWQHMLQLSPDAQVAIRRKLRGLGLLQEKLRGIPAKLHYKVDPQKYLSFLCGEVQIKIPENPETCLLEERKQAPRKAGDYVSNESDKGKEPIRTGLAADPVDNQDPADPEPRGVLGDELEAIRSELGISTSQLGRLANICKSHNCRMQDVHRALGPHLQVKGLQGQQAFLYFKKCLLDNPTRDWTYEARRDAQRQAQAEQATQAEVTRQRFIDRLAQAGGEGIAVSNGGRIFSAPPEENPTVFLKYQKPDGTNLLSRINDFLNAFPEFLED